jgi:membrane-associated phospholipid phosphatase
MPVPPVYAHDPLVAIQHLLAAPWLDGPMMALSTGCEGWALAILASIWAVWVAGSARRALPLAGPILLALVLDGAAVQVAKRIWPTPRPLAVLGPEAVRVLLEPLRAHAFPSGHASAAASVAACATFLRGLRGAPLWALAFLGGLSRIYVGAHWTFDVVAGWTLGVGAATVALAAMRVTRALRPDRLGPAVAAD